MRAKEFILNEEILNEGLLDSIKSLYNSANNAPEFLKVFNQIRQDKSKINSIIQTLQSSAKNGTLTKEQVINLVQSSTVSESESDTQPIPATDKTRMLLKRIAGGSFVLALPAMLIVMALTSEGSNAGPITYAVGNLIAILATFIYLIKYKPKTALKLLAVGGAFAWMVHQGAQLQNDPEWQAKHPPEIPKEQMIYNMAGELYNLRMQRVPLVDAERQINQEYKGKQLKMANAVLDYVYAYSPETLGMIKDPEEFRQQIRRSVAKFY